MKRSDFIKLSSAATLAYSVNGIPIHAFGQNGPMKVRSSNGKVLVIIQMSGGNDGLNTIIPIDKYSELSNARANILIDPQQVLPLTGQPNTGLHPAMSALQQLFDDGKVNIVQGVSYPDPNFSHFRATDIFFSASNSNVYEETGWIGRYIDSQFPGAPQAYPDPNFTSPLSIQIGSSVSSLFTGANGLNGLAVSNISSFYQIVSGTVDPAPATPAGNELTYIRFISQQTQAYTQAIQIAANQGNNLATYPANNYLASQLKIVARLISGGLETPVYLVNIGGFDTHDNQVDKNDNSLGQHANLLKNLSEAIAAFQDDLTQLGKDDMVTGCTLTEFGRRVKSNGSGGTDHGSGGPMIFFGNKVNPYVIGNSPNLPANATVGDNVPMQHDFRQIYNTILCDWFDLDTNTAQSVLSGYTAPILPIFKYAVGTDTIPQVTHQLSLEQNYPNPFRDHTIIRFTTSGGAVQIMLYDDMGRKIRVLYENNLPAGTFDVDIERNGLPAGYYYYEIHVGQQRMSRKMVVL